jgi:hypothetical protein
VYFTNHQNVEKALLARENLQQTVRLILSNAFADRDPGLTKLLQRMHLKIPSLFESLLPKSELETVATANIELEADDEVFVDETESRVKGDVEAIHTRPAVIGCLQSRFCKETLKLPMKSSDMSPDFKSKLLLGYRDYNMPNIVSFGAGTFQWSKKVAWTDRYEIFPLLLKNSCSMVSMRLWFATLIATKPFYPVQ